MRKDKKFAWIAGGVLIAVMVVYLIVATGSGGNQDARPVELVKQVAPESPSAADVQTDRATDASAANSTSTTDAMVEGSGSADGTASSIVTPSDSAGASRNGKPASSDVWGTLLTTGKLPEGMLMTQTPRMNQANTGSAPVIPAAMATASSDMPDVGAPQANAPLSESASGDVSASPAVVSANLPRSTGGSTHVVRQGETLSSIAADAYGSAVYWSHIARANPNVNPRQLKVGTILTLPDPAVVTAGAHAAHSPASVSIDPTRQYQVKSNDSLYKISMKLYGSPTYVDSIYELNKEAIGSNPAHLKLNMVLQLPKPPTHAVH